VPLGKIPVIPIGYMKVRVLSVGRVKQKFVLEGEREYLTRIGADWKVSMEECGASSSSACSPQEVMKREAQIIAGKIKADQYTIALDETGEELTSKQLAVAMEKLMTKGTRSVCFLIGGAFGLHESVRKQADRVISLSRLTYPHQLVRLILAEQLYRAYARIKGAPYGK